MRRPGDTPHSAVTDTVDLLLWAIVDKQAPPWAFRRASRLLGSDAAARSGLREFAAIDRSLRAWCEGQPVEVRPARGPDRSAYAARAEVLPVNGAAEPSGVVGK